MEHFHLGRCCRHQALHTELILDLEWNPHVMQPHPLVENLLALVLRIAIGVKNRAIPSVEAWPGNRVSYQAPAHPLIDQFPLNSLSNNVRLCISVTPRATLSTSFERGPLHPHTSGQTVIQHPIRGRIRLTYSHLVAL